MVRCRQSQGGSLNTSLKSSTVRDANAATLHRVGPLAGPWELGTIPLVRNHSTITRHDASSVEGRAFSRHLAATPWHLFVNILHLCKFLDRRLRK